MSELIKHFGIDWKLLIAQAINFFILLFLLKKFAYGPILKMLHLRREGIERGLKASREAEEKLEQIEELKEDTLKKARRQALTIVGQAEKSAKTRQEEIIQGGHQKAELVMADAKKVIEEEKAKIGEEVYKNAETLIKLGLEKVLGRMPAKERNEILIQEALRELKTSK